MEAVQYRQYNAGSTYGISSTAEAVQWAVHARRHHVGEAVNADGLGGGMAEAVHVWSSTLEALQVRPHGGTLGSSVTAHAQKIRAHKP